MTHQALTTYRALLDAAAVAPGKQEDNPECLPARIVIPTGDRSSITVCNTRERLQDLAEHVRKHWTLYGGGPKPDELKPKPRKASAWPAGLVRCWLGQIEDKDHAGAMLTAEQIGGWYALVGNTPDSHAGGFVAPQPVEGLPERIVSACRDDGRWIVMDRVSGLTLCNQKARSRAAAEADALDRTRETAQRRGTTPGALLSDALAGTQPAADGLDQWRERWGLVEVAPVAEVAHPVPELAPVVDQAQPVAQVAPVLDQVQPVAPEVAPVAEVAPVLDQVQPVAPEVAPVAEVAPVLDQVQPVAPSYALPGNVFDDWRGAEGLAFVPSDRQRVVLQAVERALSEGLFYSTEILARCAELLQPSDADKARGAGKVEGGYFGMDLYYAQCNIKAQKRHQEQAATLRALRPTVGDVYGVLVFNDYKVSRACKVEEVSDEGEIVLSLCRGARPGWRVTVSAVQIAYAMDRAHEKGARRGGWKDWMAAHPVPELAPEVAPVAEVAPVLDQVQPVADQVQPAPVVAVVADPAPVAAMVADPAPVVAVVADPAPVVDRPLTEAWRRLQEAYGEADPRTPPFRPALSHLRNTQHAMRRAAAGHTGPIWQPLQGHAPPHRGRAWQAMGGAAPGQHGPGKARTRAWPGACSWGLADKSPSPATDYPIIPHGFSVALTQRFRPIQARPMRTRRADIRTRRAPMRTRWQPLQPVQARAPLPCPGPAGRPGGRAGGLAPRGQAPPLGVAASAAPSPGCRGQCGRPFPGCRGQCGWGERKSSSPTMLELFRCQRSSAVLARPSSANLTRVLHRSIQEFTP